MKVGKCIFSTILYIKKGRSKMKIRYFDNAATTKVKKEVVDNMFPYFVESYGNPSSLYTLGRTAKVGIEEARKHVANLINCEKNEIYFTSGGTESDNTALKGIMHVSKNKGKHMITTKIEHHAILNSCKTLEEHGCKVTYLNVDKEGIINLEELVNAITEDTVLISVMFANNEIGSIQPIKKIGEIAKEKGIIFHTDAVQACGNVKIDVKEMNIDMLSLSGHKIGAPKGIGALYVNKNIEFKNLIDGGHQERDKRAGTENVPGMIGLGEACKIAKNNMDTHVHKLKELRDMYFSEIQKQIPDIKINGSMEHRLPGNSNISFKGINGSELLMKLDEKGICASAGSACSSGSSMPSHVLTAIGLTSEYAEGTLRVTFGDENTKEDVEYLVENLTQIVKEIRNKDI